MKRAKVAKPKPCPTTLKLAERLVQHFYRCAEAAAEITGRRGERSFMWRGCVMNRSTGKTTSMHSRLVGQIAGAIDADLLRRMNRK